MIALREMMARRDDLRIVLMSATIQTNELVQYWNGVGVGMDDNVNVNSRMEEKNEDEDEDLHADADADADALSSFRPAEIHVPGRTFPVPSFYLEDVLAMTGMVSDVKFGGELDDLEADLDKLLNAKHSTSHSMLQYDAQNTTNQSHSNTNSKSKPNKSKSKRGKHPNKNQKEQDTVIVVSEHSLVCVLCNRGGFKCAEELGSHIGLCTGMGAMDMEELEEKVRCTEVVTFGGSGGASSGDAANASNNNVIYEEEDYEFDEDDTNGKEKGARDGNHDTEDEEEDDDDDNHFGMHEGRWDGESPFAVADVVDSSSAKTTLTEEEMLNRYQMMHDDELIDCDLILETIRYIDKSSYLDGAILVFLPGTFHFVVMHGTRIHILEWIGACMVFVFLKHHTIISSFSPT